MTLASNPLLCTPIRVPVSLIGSGPLADRDRAAVPGPGVADNPPYLTQAMLYNDFIFNYDASYTDGNGVRILVEHLAPNTPYGVTLWSYDIITSCCPSADWTETASGTPVLIQTGYTFIGPVQPTDDFNYTLGGLLT